jgi:hypothetical protein
VEVTGDPFEIAVDFLVAHDVVNLIDARRARVPKGPRAVLAELFDELMRAIIGDERQVCRGVPGVRAGATPAFQQRHAHTGFLQQICRGNSRESAAHNGDIDFDVLFD